MAAPAPVPAAPPVTSSPIELPFGQLKTIMQHVLCIMHCAKRELFLTAGLLKFVFLCGKVLESGSAYWMSQERDSQNRNLYLCLDFDVSPLKTFLLTNYIDI